MGAEPICPVTKDGLHQKQPWQRTRTDLGGPPASGLACKACHKTWTWRGDVLEPTWLAAVAGDGNHGG